jgi:hypothetical protein
MSGTPESDLAEFLADLDRREARMEAQDRQGLEEDEEPLEYFPGSDEGEF